MEADDWGKVSAFVDKQLELLNAERDAEIEQTRALQEGFSPKELQKYGECVVRLHVVGRKTGVGGLFLVKLARAATSATTPLPSHRFQPGDIVGLVPSNVPISSFMLESMQKGKGGVVYRVAEHSITVSFSKMDEEGLTLDMEGNATYNLIRLANDVTYKRYRKALESLRVQVTSRTAGGGDNDHLKQVLFGLGEPRFVGHFRNRFELTPFNPNLNESQKEAIVFALGANDLALIHGPPGTGKTTTVVEFILQCVKRGERVLATAPSNIAVDNIAERLAVYAKQAGAKIVRVGHPARLLASVVGLSLDARVKQHSHQTELADDVRKEMAKLRSSLGKASPQERRGVYFQLRQLRKELWEREGKAVDEILSQANVILATNTGAADKKLQGLPMFDVAVIDEAAQAVEASCWIPVLKAKKLILAGDHCQLPPTIISEGAAKAGLSLTLFDRMVSMYGDRVRHMLLIQYRMHHKIMQWSSKEFYEEKLQAHSSVADHLLRDLPHVQSETTETKSPLIIVDTSGCGFHEETVEAKSGEQQQQKKKGAVADADETKAKAKRSLLGEGSKANQGEVDLVHQYVHILLTQGLKPEDIGIISPYNAQVDRLRHALREKGLGGVDKREMDKIEVSTVDGFQGREKEVIIISFVRSNQKGEIGFLAESRRMNVAITRAKRSVVVVCDEETINHAKNEFLKRMIVYFESEGEYVAGAQLAGGRAGGGELHVETVDQHELERLRKERDERMREMELKEDVERRRKEREEKEQKEREDRETEEQLRTEILDFLIDTSRDALTFPVDLNAWARMRVHEMAEQHGLVHASEGKAGKRQITVRKPVEEVRPSARTESKPVGEGDEEEEKEEKAAEKGRKGKKGGQKGGDELKERREEGKKERKGEEDPLAEMRRLQQEKYREHKTTEEKQKKNDGSNKKETKVKPAGAKKERPIRLEDEIRKKKKAEEAELRKMSEEELLKKFDTTKCGHKGCKESTTVLGRVCPHCRLKFCFSHSMAEIHGCGDEAKKKAREDWMHSHRPGGTVTGQTSTKPLKPQARDHLQSKLQKKLETVSHKGKKPADKDKDQKSGRGGGGAGRGGGAAAGRGGRGRGA